MFRPSLNNILAIKTHDLLSIRAIVNLSRSIEESAPTHRNFPLKNLNLLSSNKFTVKIKLYSSCGQLVYENIYSTSDFGELNIKIPTEQLNLNNSISRIQVYEISYIKDLEMLLGSFLLYNPHSLRKILITDFDKTLAETSSKNPRDIWGSLTSPITDYPTIMPTLNLIKEYLKDTYTPFIVSSSPHFYESSIRDWLYQHEIFNAHILLKDYRQMISFKGDYLKFKDVLAHGFYKLDHLLNIIFMTNIPDHLILFGDNYDVDHIIYLVFAHIMMNNADPWSIWKNVKDNPYFKLTSKQDSIFLENLYQISNLLKKHGKLPDIKIYIRKTKKQTDWAALPTCVNLSDFEINYIN
ncbi:MAG: hypothetical protein A2202_05240 [Bdellovibrionales bacterium RIFOXYA1_FULL_36_14]|nr:MAG: hypothetical protein A2202_05240 [Bdellovibrionales bacterium RIFOXYA1_FULL_36_14]